MHILIAEDDKTSKLVLETILKKWGHEVVAASDGDEAWAWLQIDDKPSLAILDRMMPGIDGTELCKRVSKNESEESPVHYPADRTWEKGRHCHRP